MTDTEAPGGAYPDDEVLLADLGRVIDLADPSPAGLVQRVQFALELENLDVEVARWERADAGPCAEAGKGASEGKLLASGSRPGDDATNGGLEAPGPPGGSRGCDERSWDWLRLPRVVRSVLPARLARHAVRFTLTIDAMTAYVLSIQTCR